MKHLAPLLALVVATSLLAVGGPGVASAQTETVTLTVSVASDDGTAVDAAILSASWENGSTTEETKSNGKAFVDVPAGANVSIAVSHPDYVRNHPYEVTDASERDVAITVAPTASAVVTVEDDEGTVDDARVVLDHDGHTVIDERTTDGTVETGAIEAGSYDVRVSKPGYHTIEGDLAVSNETETTVEIERGTVGLTVNVTDDYFDPPRAVSGATVDVEGSGSVITQSDGTQRISVPVNTEMTVTVSKEGYDSVERTVTVEESDRTLDVDVDRTDALTVEAANERVVVGEQVRVTVTDEYEDPVTDAQVRTDGEAVARTNDDGIASVAIERGGDREIVVTKGGITSPPITVTGIAADGSTTERPETTTATPTTTTTGSPAPTIPDIPGEYVPLVIIGLALLAVIYGIRRWQR
ncbi:PEGA domain-containing protein [Halanaeroarchaeum sulfurireducens]|uniref:Uncharacterized protein n=1 Tax=Halanaeroarchaeum sulfurireducens TaxID=1604004 RepID=A0A0F7P9G9_9EURY|nr:PEGA domain-containing protein [Halanaeroarchaeum sulfurireducens]AKH96850.1 hypothetical protein HLASF_0344 [Halanaeroarchaeum sulfurireducens]ALG81252.1 hypothetical protein HLASA_0343 [Halanaeroarchaeum sulfurireducens]